MGDNGGMVNASDSIARFTIRYPLSAMAHGHTQSAMAMAETIRTRNRITHPKQAPCHTPPQFRHNLGADLKPSPSQAGPGQRGRIS